jgi:hypothetical protein
VITIAPVVTQPPQNQTVNMGDKVTFSVAASGPPPLSYLWQKNSTNLDGATGTALTISNVQPADAGGYAVVVANGSASVVSSTATLTVNAYPVITNQPKSQTVFAGALVQFSVQAGGGSPLTYLWQKNGTNLNVATGTSLSIGSAQLNDAGSYRAVVTNASGLATSSPAALTVVSNVLVSRRRAPWWDWEFQWCPRTLPTP